MEIVRPGFPRGSVGRRSQPRKLSSVNAGHPETCRLAWCGVCDEGVRLKEDVRGDSKRVAGVAIKISGEDKQKRFPTVLLVTLDIKCC